MKASKPRRDAQAEADFAWLTGNNITLKLQIALDSIPMKDEAYKQSLRPLVKEFADYVKGFDKDNPYGIILMVCPSDSATGLV